MADTRVLHLRNVTVVDNQVMVPIEATTQSACFYVYIDHYRPRFVPTMCSLGFRFSPDITGSYAVAVVVALSMSLSWWPPIQRGKGTPCEAEV